MDTSYGIFDYNTNNFSAYISYQTDTSLGTIKQKRQITYLDNYINKLTDGGRVVFVYENEYVDKHYLDDYSTYYVTCFSPYRKTTSRVHFFQVDEDNLDYKEEFKKALNGDNSFLNSDNYLGYIVIRPIPQTFLAEICLRAYHPEQDRLSKYIILKEYTVSLFGIELKVKSVAFQEQDKVLSACATTALWSFLHAHPKQGRLALPSSSAITRSAYPEQNGYGREFPNAGLSTDMMCRSLREYNFAPEYFEFSKKDEYLDDKDKVDRLKEYIYAYCSSGLPLVLGVSVHGESNQSNDCHQGSCQVSNEKGLHAITVLGYSLQDESKGSLIAHNIDGLYVHDDRYGPFMKIDFTDNYFHVSLRENKAVTEECHFKDENYFPDTLIIGLYHKIRIPYLRIKNSCTDLQDYLSRYLNRMDKESKANIIKSFQWDIQIKENKVLKKDILESDIANKEVFLTKSWPKYLWSARAILEGKIVFEMIFDATDIDHGDVFLDIVPIDPYYAPFIIAIIKGYSDDHFNNKLQPDSKIRSHDNYMWGIIRSFREKETYKSSLSEQYGYLKIPNRIKEEELFHDNIINQCEARLNKENDGNKFSLDKNAGGNKFQYIWVMDIDGFLCIGKENEGSQQGHPTLTDGMPARIGGQLNYIKEDMIWEIDPFSGRYSSEYSGEEKKRFVENALKYKFQLYFPQENFRIREF